jgi:hypothetical protein
MRLITAFVVMLLGVLCGTQNVLGQETRCKEFVLTQAGFCWSSFVTPVRFGGGWAVTVKGRNAGAEAPGVVQFSWGFSPDPVARAAGVWSLIAYTTADPPMQAVICDGGGIWLVPDKSDTLVFVPAKGCDVHGQNCQNAPDPTVLAVGMIEVGYMADTPEALRGLTAPVVEMVNDDGTVVTVTHRPPRVHPLPVPAPRPIRAVATLRRVSP